MHKQAPREILRSFINENPTNICICGDYSKLPKLLPKGETLLRIASGYLYISPKTLKTLMDTRKIEYKIPGSSRTMFRLAPRTPPVHCIKIPLGVIK